MTHAPHYHHKQKPQQITKPKLMLIIILGLVLGLLLSFPATYIFGPKTKILDVSFINPRQALVFWQSNSPSIGYLKTGNKQYWRPNRVNQISQQADVVHTVLLDQIPLEGLYVSPHLEGQAWWNRSMIQLIRFQESEVEVENQEKNSKDQVDDLNNINNATKNSIGDLESKDNN